MQTGTSGGFVPITADLHTEASTDFPADYTIPFDYTYTDWPFNDEKPPINDILESIGDDCWGIYIKHKDGTIDSKINTYALFEALGHSFGAGTIPNAQYDREGNYREWVLHNHSLLLDDVRMGDTHFLMMFGEDGYKIEATLIEPLNWDIKLFQHPELGSVFVYSCSVCDEKMPANHLKTCIYCFLAGYTDLKTGHSRERFVSKIYQIGYNDGYKSVDLPQIDWGDVYGGSDRKELIRMYKVGYDAGKTKQECKTLTEKFCAALPNFLAQKNDILPLS